jgi:hypothetical protein
VRGDGTSLSCVGSIRLSYFGDCAAVKVACSSDRGFGRRVRLAVSRIAQSDLLVELA